MAESNHDPQATSRRPLARNQASSLRQLAANLPSVDHALDELIARANQTELDVGAWNTTAARPSGSPGTGPRAIATPDAGALGAEPLAPDALGTDGLDAESLDVGLLEADLREAGTREQALRHQLDDLRGRLAEAEARTGAATPRAATARSWPWLAAGTAFLGGLALMFAVTRLTSPADPSSARQARDPAVMPRPMVTPIQVPMVTPIDPPPTTGPAASAVDPPATTGIAAPTPPAPALPATALPAVDPPSAPPTVAAPTNTGTSRDPVAKPRARPAGPSAAPTPAGSSRGELADPFAEPARRGDRPAARKPPAPGSIVNPF